MINTSDLLIHPDTKIIDLGFVTRDKSYLLQRIQFWKNFLTDKNIKTILLLQHTTLDSIAIVFACAETGATIIPSSIDKTSVLSKLEQVDFVFVGPTYLMWDEEFINQALSNKEWMLLDEQVINTLIGNIQYTPTKIVSDNILIIGTSSGSTGVPKVIKHTCNTFIKAAQQSHHLFKTGDVFASHHGINHIGFLAVTMIAPLFKGVTIFTINYLHDILILSTRKILSKIALYESHLLMLNNIPGVALEKNSLKNCSVITAGGPASAKFIDNIFSLGADEIISFYGCNETLSPFFTLSIKSSFDEFNDGRVGTLVPEADYKIVDDQLWIRTPSLSMSVVLDGDGYYNTSDYVVEHNGQILYLGRSRIILPSGKKVFLGNITREIQKIDQLYDLYFAEYLIEYIQPNHLNIYATTLNSYRLLSNNANQIDQLLKSYLENDQLIVKIIGVPNNNNTMFTGSKLTIEKIKKQLESNYEKSI